MQYSALQGDTFGLGSSMYFVSRFTESNLVFFAVPLPKAGKLVVRLELQTILY